MLHAEQLAGLRLALLKLQHQGQPWGMVSTRVLQVELGSLLVKPQAQPGVVTERNARPDNVACSVSPEKS